MGKGKGQLRKHRRPAIEPPTANHGRDWARDLLVKLNAPADSRESFELQLFEKLFAAE